MLDAIGLLISTGNFFLIRSVRHLQMVIVRKYSCLEITTGLSIFLLLIKFHNLFVSRHLKLLFCKITLSILDRRWLTRPILIHGWLRSCYTLKYWIHGTHAHSWRYLFVQLARFLWLSFRVWSVISNKLSLEIEITKCQILCLFSYFVPATVFLLLMSFLIYIRQFFNWIFLLRFFCRWIHQFLVRINRVSHLIWRLITATPKTERWSQFGESSFCYVRRFW